MPISSLPRFPQAEHTLRLPEPHAALRHRPCGSCVTEQGTEAREGKEPAPSHSKQRQRDKAGLSLSRALSAPPPDCDSPPGYMEAQR